MMMMMIANWRDVKVRLCVVGFGKLDSEHYMFPSKKFSLKTWQNTYSCLKCSLCFGYRGFYAPTRPDVQAEA